MSDEILGYMIDGDVYHPDCAVDYVNTRAMRMDDELVSPIFYSDGRWDEGYGTQSYCLWCGHGLEY